MQPLPLPPWVHAPLPLPSHSMSPPSLPPSRLAGLWCLEFLWSFYVLKLVLSTFRGKNMTIQQARREAAAGAVAAVV